VAGRRPATSHLSRPAAAAALGTGTAGTGVNTLLHRPVAPPALGTTGTRSWQVFYPDAILTRNSSQTPFNTAKNQFNQQRE